MSFDFEGRTPIVRGYLHVADIIQVDDDDRVLIVDVFSNADEVLRLEGDVCERDALGSDANVGELDMLGKVDGLVRHVDPEYDAARRTGLPGLGAVWRCFDLKQAMEWILGALQCSEKEVVLSQDQAR